MLKKQIVKLKKKPWFKKLLKAATIQISQSKSLLKDSYVSAENLKTQLNQLYSAIETVYTELQRAGHGKKIALRSIANSNTRCSYR